jgi:pimeloyl-ACP methyl ester carboxylesterase
MKTLESKVEINGIDIHYRSYGTGEPLLMIMGLGANADWWGDNFIEPLADAFEVVVFDNRGAGRSGKPEGPYSISLMASDTAGLMEHLGWDSANIAGLSMGGMIAQQLTLDHPEKVRKLVLMSTNCGGREQTTAEPEVYQLLNAPRETLTDEQIARASLYLIFPFQYINDNPDLMEEVVKIICIAPTPLSCYIEQLKAVSKWSIYTRLDELRLPTLILSGSEDILIPPANSRVLHEKISGSRLVELPGGGHQINIMFPEKVTGEILEFLS